MKYLPTVPYPENEKAKLSLLESLFREWHQHFANIGSALKAQAADTMVFDGFYPYYFSQRKRVLFVAWEPVDLEGSNYIDILYKCYRETKRIADRHLNQSQFHCLMMYLVYGISKGMPTWHEIPDASIIGDTFAGPNGLSFAFMNISKLNNETWRANHASINAAYAISSQPRNFIQEEVAILEPHIIIAMKLGEKIASLGQLTPIADSEHEKSYWLGTGAHRSLLINTTSHFAARKPNIEGYYTPICNAILRSEMA